MKTWKIDKRQKTSPQIIIIVGAEAIGRTKYHLRTSQRNSCVLRWPVVNNPPASAGDAMDISSIPGSGRVPGGGNGNPLQYSCLENSMHREAW